MKIFLVGGAVRDELLGLPVKERDWVVVGATPEELVAQGYQPVGKEFPVFLHPKTHEEYALARTERKVGRGYKGFHFYTSPNVTLEEDLIRRDLTINAMARSENGTLIDPFGGQQDLKNKLLRHISPAFAEDPVRILRAARFASRFSDFKVHPETNQLMKQMVLNGEVDALVSERVWQELEKALTENNPLRFFEVLNDCDALNKLFPEIKIDHTGLRSLAIAIAVTNNPSIRFAVLCHDIPLPLIKKLCTRLRAPKIYQDLACLVAQWLHIYLDPTKVTAEQILDLLKSVDIFRRPDRFEDFLIACQACEQTHKSISQDSNKKLFQDLSRAVNAIDIRPLIHQQLTGATLAQEIQKLRITEIRKILKKI